MSATRNRAHSQELKGLLDQLAAPEFANNLCGFVTKAFYMARSHRCSSGVEDEMVKSLRAYNNQYNPEEMQLLEPGADVYMGITRLKCEALQNWVLDIFANSEDKPWTLNATPVPELPDRLEDIVANRLEQELSQFGFQGTEEELQDLVADMKALALNTAQELAASAVKGMETKIHDQMLSGGWRKAFEEFVVDLSIYPTAVLHGPYLDFKQRVRHRRGEVVRTWEPVWKISRVSPFDIFPAPNADSPNDGSFMIWRERASQKNLYDMIGMYGVDEIAVRQLIADKPNGATEWLQTSDGEVECLERKDEDATLPDQRYHVLNYHGMIPGDMLLDHGIAQVDPHTSVEAEIRVCCGKVLRAMLNPHPTGKRPFHAVPYQINPGSFWGTSLPTQLRDIQRVANGAARAMVKNMAYSAGPIGEYDVDRLEADDEITEVQPYRLFAVRADPFSSQSSAIRFTQMQSVTRNLLDVYDRFSRQADDQSGIPPYAIGSPQTSGAARTLGGLSLLMGNAAKGVKRVISTADRRAVEPIVEAFYLMNLLYSADESIKADAEVLARGSAGLLQRELNQGRALEALQVLTPYAQPGPDGQSIVPGHVIRVVLRDWLTSIGYDADTLIPDPQRANQLLGALAAAGADPSRIQSPAPGTPLPSLDGRSTPPPDPSAAEVLPQGF